ncbi:MAG TPA: NAD-dependent epimerase/dehydratase family protein [Acidimicrobiales bacterium]
MKVLVMGGSRFNGLALVQELAAAGHDVSVVNRGQSGGDLPDGVRRLVADRTDHGRLGEVLAGQDFDCVHDVSAYHPEDVEVMIELLDGRVGHYVFVSSTVIYAATDILPITEDHPVDRSAEQSEYGLHKLLCEDLLLTAHHRRRFPATIVALSMVFGPRNIVADREQRMMARLLAGRPVLIPGDGTTLGQVGYVDDQARALRMMMGRSSTFGRRYNLTGNQYFSDHGYVDTLAAVVGVDARKVSIPAGLMDQLWDHHAVLSEGATPAGADMAASGSRTGDRVIRQRYVLSGLIPRIAPNLHRWNRSVLFSTERLRQDVGWVPEVNFRTMAENTYEWFCRQPAAHRTRFDFSWEDDLADQVAGQ